MLSCLEGGDYGGIIQILLLTGQRREEVGGMRWSEISVTRFFGSEFHARSSDAVWRAGITLSLKPFHQRPAGSLPNDDVSLTRLAELDRNLKACAKVKNGALRGWILCDDGRLYHPVVAEKVLEAWVEKLRAQRGAAKTNAKRWGSAAGSIDDQIDDALRRLAQLNPQARGILKAHRYAGKETDGGRDPGSAPSLSESPSDRLATRPGGPSESQQNGSIGTQTDRTGRQSKEPTDTSECGQQSNTSNYAFARGIIRLSPSELKELQELTPHLGASLKSHLMTAASFAGKHWGDNWKKALPQWLAKKDRERQDELIRAKAQGEAAAAPKYKPPLV